MGCNRGPGRFSRLDVLSRASRRKRWGSSSAIVREACRERRGYLLVLYGGDLNVPVMVYATSQGSASKPPPEPTT